MSSLTSRILKTSKSIVFGLIVLTIVWFLYRFASRMLSKAMKSGPAKLPSAEFATTDVVMFEPKPFAVTSLESDKTVDALLSGQFGPVVLMFYADWCTHCKTMMDAYEAAAALSRVPFVKVQGQLAPVSAQKHAVTGYPTIFGISFLPGPPRRFASMRTKEGLLEFANALGGPATEGPAAPAAMQPVATAVPVGPLAPAAGLVAAPLAPVAPVMIPPTVTLTD